MAGVDLEETPRPVHRPEAGSWPDFGTGPGLVLHLELPGGAPPEGFSGDQLELELWEAGHAVVVYVGPRTGSGGEQLLLEDGSPELELCLATRNPADLDHKAAGKAAAAHVAKLAKKAGR